MIVAVNACIRRFYRIYVEVPDDSSVEAIEASAEKYIMNASPEELEKQLKTFIEIIPEDIELMDIDEESIQALNNKEEYKP